MRKLNEGGIGLKTRAKQAISQAVLGFPKLLVDTWGYPMTFVEFYKVLSRTKLAVQIVKMNSLILGDSGKFNGYSGKAIPNVSEEVAGEKLQAEIRKDENGKEYFLLHTDDSAPHYLREWNGHAVRFNHLSNS